MPGDGDPARALTDLPCIAETAGIADLSGPAHFGAGLPPFLDESGHVRPLEEIESELIRFAITHYRGRMSEVARRLRIGRSTLYRKLESLGLAHSDTDSDRESVAAE
jgi:DNA-binding NtrC family response regulator